MSVSEVKGYLASWGWVVCALLAFAFSWNAQSFWIDECCTALCAVQENVDDVWKQIHAIGGSDAQIALYYYLLYLWHLLTGADTELSLRLFNVCWTLLGAWFFRKEPVALIMLLISPFFIYYTNELRNYILQIAVACWVSMIFYRTSLGRPINYQELFASLWCLCLVSLTCVVWALGFVSAFSVLAWSQFRGRSFLKAVAVWCLPFMALACYYVYTLMIGARAVSIKSNVIVNAGASLYELFGIAGLGPERSELRLCKSLDSLFTVEGLGVAIVCGVIIFTALCYGTHHWLKKSKIPLGWSLLVLLLVPGAVFFYSAVFMDFRFSGRHCAPIFPILVLAWVCVWPGFKNMKTRPLGVILTILMLGVWIVGDFRIRFTEKYSRENYREAIEYCNDMRGQGNKVLLLCNEAGKKFYGWNGDKLKFDTLSSYDCIVVTRPDTYKGIIRNIEQSGEYECSQLCQAFTVYRKKLER